MRVDCKIEQTWPTSGSNSVPFHLCQYLIVIQVAEQFYSSGRGSAMRLQNFLDVLAQRSQGVVLVCLKIAFSQGFRTNFLDGGIFSLTSTSLRLGADLFLNGKRTKQETRSRRTKIVRKTGVRAKVSPVKNIVEVLVFVVVISVAAMTLSLSTTLCRGCGSVPSVILHKQDTLGDEFVDVDTGGVVAESKLCGSFQSHIRDVDEQARINRRIGSLLDTAVDLIGSINDGFQLSAIFQVDILILWTKLAFIRAREEAAGTSTIELALEGTGLFLYLLAFMLVLGGVVEARIVILFMVSDGGGRTWLDPPPLCRVRIGGARHATFAFIARGRS